MRVNITPCKRPLRICGAVTRSGSHCENPPIKGRTRCRLHGGFSTGPTSKEGRAAIAKANTRHGRYCDWRRKKALDKFYRAEIIKVMNAAQTKGLLPTD